MIEKKRFDPPLVLSFHTRGAVIPNEIALSLNTNAKPSASTAPVENQRQNTPHTSFSIETTNRGTTLNEIACGYPHTHSENAFRSGFKRSSFQLNLDIQSIESDRVQTFQHNR